MNLSDPQLAEKIAALDKEGQAKALDLLERLERAKRTNRIEEYQPYPWQRAMHEAGKDKPERMARAANQTGKTKSGGCETAYHATGEYPDWWTGRRFHEKNLVIWVGSKTAGTSRDIVQAELLGDVSQGEEFGTGLIPKRCIIDKPSLRQSAVSDVVDFFWVRRANGGKCKVQFLTYEMGWQKWQGKRVHFIWLDEEPAKGEFPTDEDYKVFTECLTRILTNQGCILVTFTPLSGRTPLVEHFDSDPPVPGTAIFTATWDDAPHLSKERRAQLAASYPSHEVAARTRGVPMVGSGLLWNIPEELIIIDDFPLKESFRQIIGCDFGIGHPGAGAHCAYDALNEVFYVLAVYKKSNEGAAYHASRFNQWGHWIPVSWPHDGHKKEMGDAGKLIEIRHQYQRAGANMLAKSARYAPKPDPKTGKLKDTGGSQPVRPIIEQIREEMISGKFRVFRSASKEVFEEIRQFHVNAKNEVVAKNDDIIKAIIYARMMTRYAVPRSALRSRSQGQQGQRPMRWR